MILDMVQKSGKWVIGAADGIMDAGGVSLVTWLALCKNETGAFAMNQIMGVIFSVIIVVVGLVMFPLILNQTQTARSNTYIANFAGVQAITDLIPLLYAVGVLGLAGTVALVSLRAGGR